jgi:hypothetical protein
LEIWNAELNSIEKKNRGTSSIQLNILILQLTVYLLWGVASFWSNQILGGGVRPDEPVFSWQSGEVMSF